MESTNELTQTARKYNILRVHDFKIHIYSDYDLNIVCHETCIEETLECVMSCDPTDSTCISVCLRAEDTCLSSENFSYQNDNL